LAVDHFTSDPISIPGSQSSLGIAQQRVDPEMVRRRRQPNHRLIKIHRNYSVDEAARRLGVHKNTVRRWPKAGLERVEGKGLTIFRGSVLRAFLAARRDKAKRPSPPGHMFCLRCRATKEPAEKKADLTCTSSTVGNLRARCPDCSAIMNRRVSLARLSDVRGSLDITMPKHPDA
jgi:hypothetical protein